MPQMEYSLTSHSIALPCRPRVLSVKAPVGTAWLVAESGFLRAGAAQRDASAGLPQRQSGHLGAVRGGRRRAASRAAVESDSRGSAQPAAAAGAASQTDMP